jgi:hypothetical protein
LRIKHLKLRVTANRESAKSASDSPHFFFDFQKMAGLSNLPKINRPGPGVTFGLCFFLIVTLTVVVLTTPYVKHSYDGPVIIIGGGAAGISAGKVLHDHGIDFTILEAAPSIGGRMKHVEWEGLTIELGANWIHGFETNFGE